MANRLDQVGETTVRNPQGQIIGYEKVDNSVGGLKYVPEEVWMKKANELISTNTNPLKPITTGDIVRELGGRKSSQWYTEPDTTPTPPPMIAPRNPYMDAKDTPGITKDSMAGVGTTNRILGLDDKKWDVPRSRETKQWAFGNQDYEGVYKPIEKGTMTLGAGTIAGGEKGVSVMGTLYQSDTGRWQVIDKLGHLAMSGSADAPLPTRDKAYEDKPWTSINNYVPPPQKDDLPSTVSIGSLHPPANYWVEDPETGRMVNPETPEWKKKNNNPYGSNTPGYSDYGVRDVLGIEDKPSVVKRTGVSPLNRTEGNFGSALKQKRRNQTHKPPIKSGGFMSIFNNVKQSTPKKATNLKNTDMSYGLSYTGIGGTRNTKPSKPIKAPIKKPLQSPVKKPTTKKKEIGFGNAYEVLFSNKRGK